MLPDIILVGGNALEFRALGLASTVPVVDDGLGPGLYGRIFRVMKKADDERPLVGDSSTCLGVRVPTDIEPTADGSVHPGTGGMSVNPSLADCPPHLVPKRLRHLMPEARSSERNFVWRIGERPFVRGPVAMGSTCAWTVPVPARPPVRIAHVVGFRMS